MNKIIFLLITLLLFGCNSPDEKATEESFDEPSETIESNEYVSIDDSEEVIESTEDQDFYFLHDRLPDWVVKSEIIKGMHVDADHVYDNRMNPLYLEADFNGDGELDVALPIIEVDGERCGIAVIHGESFEVHILGAGGFSENGIGDDLSWCDLWKVNRQRVNAPGIDATEDLILDNPSIQIEKSEVGGGQIYWNGEEYAYFHQTC